MIDDLNDSIRNFKERRFLIISWLLTIVIGITGNITASAMLGWIESPTWDIAIFFLLLTIMFGGILLIYFSPRFKHVIKIFYGTEVVDAMLELFKLFKFPDPQDRLSDFMKIYNALMVRDFLREIKPKTIKIKKVLILDYSFELWLFIESSILSFLDLKIEEKISEEVDIICDRFGSTILPLKLIDEKTTEKQLQTFYEALNKLNPEYVENELINQIIRITDC